MRKSRFTASEKWLIVVPFLLFVGLRVFYVGWQGSTHDVAAIYESIVLYQIQHYGVPIKAKTYFLDMTAASMPLTPQLLQRFRQHKIVVKQANAVAYGRGWDVIDKATGQQAMICQVGAIRWVAWSWPKRVEVEGSIKGGQGSIYHLTYVKGQWIVTGEENKWVA